PRPFQQLEEPRMQSRFAAGELEDLDLALAVNDALDTLPQFLKRHRIHIVVGAHGRICVTGRAGEIARTHNLDQREAGGERLERFLRSPLCVAAERAGFGAIRGATCSSVAAAVRVSRLSL